MAYFYLIKKTNTYTSVTDNYIDNRFFFRKSKRYHAPPSKKCSVVSRRARIIQIGHGCEWTTFLTLTFAPDYYWADYDLIQQQYRRFIKSLYYSVGKFKYLAVLEHGGKTGRIHYHMLTDIPWTHSIFEFAFHDKRKVCNIWDFGFSDVVKVKNDKVNAVYYMCKYLGKTDKNRTPIGKREVFSSRGLSPKDIVVTTDVDVVNYYTNSLKEYVKIGHSHIYIKNREVKI